MNNLIYALILLSLNVQAVCIDEFQRLFFKKEASAHSSIVDDMALKGVGKKIIIKGPFKLHGEIKVNTAKNAYLPILASVILSKKPVHLYDLPKISDVNKLKIILNDLGVKISEKGNITTFDSSSLKTNMATCEMVTKMRASILFLGPLIARYGAGKVALPGGCPIGARPIDLHLEGLRALGIDFEEGDDFVQGVGKFHSLAGGEINLRFPSVGATENIMSAAVFAEGETIIKNAAREPEIDDLMSFLNNMGANISWKSEGVMKIVGVKELREVHYRAIGDRIEAGTYVLMGLMSRSHVKVSGFNPIHLGETLDVLRKMNAKMTIGEDYIEVFPSDLRPINVTTLPHPGFPTDMQAQLMALLSTVDGESKITETLFENRFMHAEYFNKLGAEIIVKENHATIRGKQNFNGENVVATDLRAAAALIMMASRINGITEIHDVKHLFRGYSDIIEKLNALGVDIKMVNE